MRSIHNGWNLVAYLAIIWAIISAGLPFATPVLAQSNTPAPVSQSALNGLVTALAVRADQLLIGQNMQLVDAAITADGLTVNQIVELGHGAIRAIAVADDQSTVVVTEDGLVALDVHNTQTDFAAGGGYRVVIHHERVYVAALGAGVRVYTLRSGKLIATGQIGTTQPAEDIATEGANGLWVATGSGGVQLYDLTAADKPILLSSDQSLTPAHLVRTYGLHLLVGYGNRIAVLSTVNVKAPTAVSTLTLDGSAGARASDAIYTQSDIVLGRSDVSGTDVLHTTLSPPDSAGHQTLSPFVSDGTDGAGDRLARYGDDLFIGSERSGLRRVRIVASGMTTTIASLASWPAAQFGGCTLADYRPSQPSPANLSVIPPEATITLHWQAACVAAHYQVTVEGQLIATVDRQTVDYTLPANHDVLQWQVTAQTDSGTISGAPWTLSLNRAGYLTTPSVAVTAQPVVLYMPPPITIDFSALQSPGWLLAESCLALVIGIAVIVFGASAIGGWAARRRGESVERH